jgi:hypothetical protein
MNSFIKCIETKLQRGDGCDPSLFCCLGETDAVITEIENRIELSYEDIAQNP